MALPQLTDEETETRTGDESYAAAVSESQGFYPQRPDPRPISQRRGADTGNAEGQIWAQTLPRSGPESAIPPLGASVSFFPPSSEHAEEDKGALQGCGDKGVMHLKCGGTEGTLGAWAQRPAWPFLASDRGPLPSPGAFSLCPTPICMPSCRPWQVS